MKKFVPFDEFEKSCSPVGKPLAASMQESCDATLVPDTPVPCSVKPCPPYWQRTENKRCLPNGLVDVQELDGCGNERWVRTAEAVIWTDTEETTCVSDTDATERIFMQQVDQCGNTRQVFTGRFCCVPTWVNTNEPPVYDCAQSMLRVDQEDGCGNTRLYSTGLVVAWIDTANRRCQDNRYQREETNQCGDLRWVDNGPFVWSDTGETRCDGALIEKEQVNQCGTLRWVSSGSALVWTDTANKTCDGTYEVEQENQCGETRMDPRGAIVWVNTGETQCGPITDNIENEQANQCGDLRWLNTGVSCTVPDPALPSTFGGGCFVENVNPALGRFALKFNSNGTGTRPSLFGGGTAPFNWAPSIVDGAEYEIMVDYTFSGVGAGYSGPADGVWTSLATMQDLVWTVTGPTPSSAILSGTVNIRLVGNTDPDSTATIEDTFISVGVECP